MKTSIRSARRPRLTVDALERRDTPAGSVTAVYSGGVLALIGDVGANHVQISAVPDGSGSDVVVTGIDGTQIFGQTEFEGVRAIRANLKGGDDILSADPAAPFALGGALSVDLGDGNNALDLQPASNLGLGALTVRATSGADVIRMTGPDGGPSWVVGNVHLALGEGGSTTTLSGLDILGRMNLAAGEGDDSLTTDDVRIGRPAGFAGARTGSVTVSGGKGAMTVETTDSALPATTLSARGPATWNALNSSFVSLSATSGDSAQVAFTDSFALRGVSVTGGPKGAAKLSLTGANQVSTGPVAVRGGDAEVTITDAPAAHLGKLDVVGWNTARFATDGSAVQVDGQASVKATHGTATMSAAGHQAEFLKGLTVHGWDATNVSFATTGTGEEASSIAGDLVITGGKGDDVVRVNEHLQVDGHMRVSAGAGSNLIDLGGETTGMIVSGRMTLTTAQGDDDIKLRQMDVRGPVSIFSGEGADQLSLQGPSLFAGAVLIDQGGGSDSMAVGTESQGVRFNGPVSIRQGTGDDRMTLDASPGDASGVAFAVPGSRIDGGSGTDTLNQTLIEAGIGANVRFVNYENRG